MRERSDIQTRTDLEEMLTAFYTKVFKDDVISHFFTEVVPLDLEHHLPLITDFWESVLLEAKGYRKNVMEVHQNIHSLSAIDKKHFDRWVQLFTQTVDEFFEGAKATLAKQRAQSIATMMNIKMNHPNPLKG
jgi:hemoglobin